MPQIGRAHAQDVLDLTLRTGALLLASQAGTADVEATMSAIAGAYGLPRTHLDVTGTTILVSIPRGVEGGPLTAMWRVQNRVADYTTLSRSLRLAQRIADERPDPGWVHAQLDTLENEPHPYPRWVQTVSLGVMAGALAVLLGARAPVALVATAVTMLVDETDRLLAHYAIPVLFQRVAGGAIATGVALALTASGILPEQAMPSLIVASNIVAQLSGMALVASVQDAITGFHLTATGRFMEIALSSIGLFIGIGGALRVGAAFGVDSTVSTNLGTTWLNAPVQIIAGAGASAAAAVAGYAPKRAITAAAISGAFGTATYVTLLHLYDGRISSAFLAAAAIGLIGSIVAHRAGIPLLIVLMSGIMPLVPGFTLYASFVNIVGGDTALGIQLLVSAIGTALALAAGVVAGPLLAPAARSELRRLRRITTELGQREGQPWPRTPALAAIKVRRRHFEPRPRGRMGRRPGRTRGAHNSERRRRDP